MAREPFKHLKIGAAYSVVKAFADYDRAEHPVGETWTFLGHTFLPYDDGLSLFVSPDGQAEEQIRLRWAPEEQGALIEALESYIQPKPSNVGRA